MDIITLSTDFYMRFSDCKEILQKGNRPYLMVLISIDDVTFAVPFRSHIRHNFAYWTDKENRCGLDFTKAVVILSENDISAHNVQIRQNEFNAIKGKEYFITQKFTTFIRQYKKAYSRTDIERNKMLIDISALQYFAELFIK